MATLHLLIVSTEHGDSPSLHATEEDAKDAAYEYAAEYWDQDGPGRHGVPIPEDRDEAIDDYFEDSTDETYSIMDIPVPDPEPTPPQLPPIVYADESTDSWMAQLNSMTGWNARLTFTDGTERDVEIESAEHDDAAASYGVHVTFWQPGDLHAPARGTPTSFVPADSITRIWIY